MGNNSTEFPEIKDGKRRDIPIISVNNTPYANSTVFPTINKGEAVEDMEQTRVKIGVKKLLDLVSGMLSHDKEFHVLDFRKIHEDQVRNLSNISENNTISEINADATETFLIISAGNTTEDMEKCKFNTTELRNLEEPMEEPEFKIGELLERFPGTISWVIGIVAVVVLFCVFALILQIRACKQQYFK